jgi:hypothetical protein
VIRHLFRRRRPRRRITLGKPVFTNREGKIVMAQYPTNLILYFPIEVNGAPPPSVDTFTVTESDAAVFTASIGTMPSGSPDPAIVAGNPAVVVTPLTLAGALGLSFTVNDGQGDLPGSESFDLVTPVAPPPPPGQISIDDAGVVSQTNPNPPTS